MASFSQVPRVYGSLPTQTAQTDKQHSSDTFSHTAYANFRPTYPESFYQQILAYHGATSSRASLLDLGCGPGTVTRALAPHFTTATGIDPSPGMLAVARQLTPEAQHPNVAYRQGTVEDLSSSSLVAPGSVDVVVAATAAHWFDFDRAWAQLARVVRPGGTLAFWGYGENTVAGEHAALFRDVWTRYYGGGGEVRPGMRSIGEFFDGRGFNVTKNGYEAIVPPTGEWEDVRRAVVNLDDLEEAKPEALQVRKVMRLEEIGRYGRTVSAYDDWAAAHPQFRPREEGGEGDILDLMMEEVVQAVPEWKAKGDGWKDVEVEVVWATSWLMAKRK